jgi:phosphoglycerate dehydrogenase-like enzyme
MIRAFSPKLTVQQSRNKEEALALAKDADILLAGFFSLELFKAARRLNASRGEIIKEAELIEALKEGCIAGAALDTFSVEPLPEGSPLWSMQNVIITPHVAGLTPRYFERLTDLFCDNLRRFMNNEALINVVDKGRGY